MCGRFTQRHAAPEIAEHFELDPDAVPELRPRFNIAPTQPVAVVRRAQGVAERELAEVRWGLVPHWVDDPDDWPLLINARSETAAEKPAFRGAFRNGRCLVVASGFYEWREENGSKTPHYVRPRDDRPVGFAGLWDRREREGEEPLESGTILTCEPNEMLRKLHDRMPVMLPADDHEAWLDPSRSREELQGLLRPYPQEELLAYPVARRVNKTSNDGPELMEPEGEPIGPVSGEGAPAGTSGQMDLGLE
jgi:putative SOS response-associated peptidase YedK